MHNILSFDIEEYFQVANFTSVITRSDWSSCASRVRIGLETILSVLDEYHVKATFFVLGWVAERNMSLIKHIAQEGHDIGTHGYGHELVYQLTPYAFREDVRKSISVLTSITGKPVTAYRAPSFSITRRSLWTLDILCECGIETDSSIFPIVHDRYGMPGAERLPHVITTEKGHTIREFPLSTFRWGPLSLPFSGGGYFRLLPVSMTIAMTKQLNAQGVPVIFYLHPWEFDPGQPRIGASAVNRFRHYVNLARTRAKLRTLLHEIQTMPLRSFTEYRREVVLAPSLPRTS